MKKLYVVSSTEFDCLSEAASQLEDWLKSNCLDPAAKIYEVGKIYEPKIVLKEVKE